MSTKADEGDIFSMGAIVGFILGIAIAGPTGQCIGHSEGYDEHRRVACERDHGVWMVSATDPSKRACVTGERR